MTAVPAVLPDRVTLQGVGLRLLAELEGAESLPPLPAVTRPVLDPLVEQLQPQIGLLGTDTTIRMWVNAAAIIEAHGFHDVAVDLVEGLRRVVTSGRTDDEARAFDAFLWTRRGRIARLAAQLDDAEQCYREALRRTPRQRTDLWWSDVVSNAWLGLSILAVGRGNYPLAQQEARKVLVSHVPPSQQVQAHLLLALILKKRGRFGAALAHVWQAFDLLPDTDPRRADALVTLGEIAAEVGEWESALHARLAALALPILPRVAVAALTGLLGVLAQPNLRANARAETIIAQSAWGRRVLAGRTEMTVVARAEGHAQDLLRPKLGIGTTGGGLTAHDQVVLALSLAELIAADERYSEAAEWLEFAEMLAVRHGFHERQFQVDALRRAWSEQRAVLQRDPSPTQTVVRTKRARRTTVWRRMDGLEALAVRGGGAG